MSAELISQLVNPDDAQLSAGSNTAVQWRCPVDDRHIWTATPNTRRRSPGCPVCMNKIVLPGVNDLATTHPDLAAELLDAQSASCVHAGDHTKVAWTCSDPTHPSWQAEVVSRTRRGSGCPYCSGRRPIPGVTDLATTHPNVAAMLLKPTIAHEVGAGSTRKAHFRCPVDPEHEWLTSVRNVAQKNTGCPQCARRTARSKTRHQRLNEINSALLAEAVDPVRTGRLSLGSGTLVEWRCTECSVPHTYTMSVRHRLRGQSCPVKAGTAVMAGVNDLATTHPDLAAELIDQTLSTQVSRGSTHFAQWRCAHGHTWQAPIYARVAGNNCPHCCPKSSSYGEQEVFAVAEVLHPGAQHRVRLSVSSGHGCEVDVLAGSLAIEFNGTFWHSEAAGRNQRYHAEKVAAIRAAGCEPLTIWEDDWADLQRRAVLITTMAHRLRCLSRLEEAMTVADIGHLYDSHTIEHIGARSLDIRELSQRDADAFFTRTHIQGPVLVTHALGLVDDQGLVRAVLGLRSPRHNARAQRSAGQWEIQRYATRGVIPGGFSKLLAHAARFLRARGAELNAWVTLSADESSSGALYRTAGFSIDGAVRPSYWYSGGLLRQRRVAKESFQLKRFRTDAALIYEDGWTEREAAAANKLYRVWDAGKTRWIKPVNKP